METQNGPRVVVVGGGISGLVAAWRLTQLPDPPDVAVLEATATPGGKLRLDTLGDLRIDVGAESLLARRPEALDLMLELGLGPDVVHPETAAATVYTRRRLFPVPQRTLMGVPAQPEGLRGLLTEEEVLRVAAEPGMPVTPVGGDVDVASWVASRVGPAVVERLVEPLLGGVYAGHASLLSLQATIPQVWELATRGGSLLHGVSRLMPAEAQSAVPGAPPPVFAGLRGGVARLPAELTARLTARGARVVTGTTVRGLRRTLTGWILETGPAGSPQYLEADGVVLAVPPSAAARLLHAECPAAAAELGAIETASVAVVAALVPREVTAGLTGSGVLVPPVEQRPVKAVTFSSAKWGWVDALSAEHVVVRMSLGRAREEQVLQREDGELVALACADLAEIVGRPVRPVATQVTRWGGSLPQYAVGHRLRVERIRAAVADAEGLAVCGAALDGVGIPACIAAADAAARDLARHLQSAQQSAQQSALQSAQSRMAT